jgi:hypothetical protein
MTDGWVYISKRIVTEVVRNEAANNAAAIAPVVESPPDYENVFDLALRTTSIVAHQTKSLDDRSIRSGDFVRTEMDFHPVRLQVWRHWDIGYDEIAAFVGIERFSWGRSYVGLVGSTHSYELDTTTIRRSGRTPSNADGLYELIGQALEETSPRFHDLANRDAEIVKSKEPYRFSLYAQAFHSAQISSPRRTYDVLFSVHDVGTDVAMNMRESDGRTSGVFASVIIGAPVWIRELPRESDPPFPASTTGRESHRTALTDASANASINSGNLAKLSRRERWDVFDYISDALSSVLAHSRQMDGSLGGLIDLAKQIPDLTAEDDAWQDFCTWFADQAGRFGPLPIEFVGHPRRKFRSWMPDKNRFEPSGRFGRCLESYEGKLSDRCFMILTDGCVYLTSASGWTHDDGAPAAVPASSSRPYSARMMLQSARWRFDPFNEDVRPGAAHGFM